MLNRVGEIALAFQIHQGRRGITAMGGLADRLGVTNNHPTPDAAVPGRCTSLFDEGVAMQSVEYVHGWWVLRACRRNPLVRGIDRLELLIIALGILVALVAAACAGAQGTAVHHARSRVYIAQAQTRHTVTARATDDSAIVLRVDDSTATRVNARWQVNGTEHTAASTGITPSKPVIH